MNPRSDKGRAVIRRSMKPTVRRPEADEGLDPYEGHRGHREACVLTLSRVILDPDLPGNGFDEKALGCLAAWIKARGVIEPVRVRWDEVRGLYIVVHGDRWFRAAQLAGLSEIPAVVIAGDLTPEELLVDRLVANCLREDLRPIEQARAFRSLMDGLGLSQRQLAARLHVSQTSVSQALALLGLPEDVREAVDRGEVAPAVAYEVSRVGDPAKRLELAGEALAGNLDRERARAAARPRQNGYSRGGSASYAYEHGRVCVTGAASLAEVVTVLRRALADAKRMASRAG